jgi:oxygen-dependent protoporphyrinogen oxidase
MIRTRHVNGFILEDGPNVLVEKPELAALIDELDLRSQVRYPVIERYKQHVWFKGRAVAAPKGIVPFMTSPLFPLATKLSLPYRLLKRGVLASDQDDETVLQFFSKLLGEKAVRAVLDPVLKGIYGGEVDQLSARTLFPKLWATAAAGDSIAEYMKSRKGQGGSPKVLVFDRGIADLTGRLVQRLHGKVEIVPQAVASISRRGTQHEVNCEGGRTLDAESVVLTPSGETLARLLEPLTEGIARQLRAMRFATLVMAHLSVPRSEPLLPESFGVLFPGGMPENLLGMMFKSIIFPHVAPPDRHLVSVVVGGAQAGDAVPDLARIELEVPKLAARYLGVKESVWLGSGVWPKAIPQFPVGHHRLVTALDELEMNLKGVVIAGLDRGGVGVSDRVRVAREAVARLVA